MNFCLKKLDRLAILIAHVMDRELFSYWQACWGVDNEKRGNGLGSITLVGEGFDAFF